MGKDGLLRLIRGVTAVGSQVVARRQDQDQFSSDTAIEGRLLQCVRHNLSILKQEE